MSQKTIDPELLESGEDLEEQSLLEHLNELRKHLTRAAIGLLVATVLSFVFAEQLLLFLLDPYASSVPSGGELQTLRPTEGIETFFKVSLMSGAILSMPYTLIEIWRFISPALTNKEKRLVFIFLPSALGLFLIGISFAWFVLMPAAVFFLAGFLPDIFSPEWTSQEYISFVVSMLFWLGVSFEMPVIVYFVGRGGLVSGTALREQWRIAVVGVAVLAALITPSVDPVTMLLTMAPLLVLYGMSIVTANIGYRQFEKSVEID